MNSAGGSSAANHSQDRDEGAPPPKTTLCGQHETDRIHQQGADFPQPDGSVYESNLYNDGRRSHDDENLYDIYGTQESVASETSDVCRATLYDDERHSEGESLYDIYGTQESDASETSDVCRATLYDDERGSEGKSVYELYEYPPTLDSGGQYSNEERCCHSSGVLHSKPAQYLLELVVVLQEQKNVFEIKSNLMSGLLPSMKISTRRDDQGQLCMVHQGYSQKLFPCPQNTCRDDGQTSMTP